MNTIKYRICKVLPLLFAGVALCSCSDDNSDDTPPVVVGCTVELQKIDDSSTQVRGLSADGAAQIAITIKPTGGYTPTSIAITPAEGWGDIDGTELATQVTISDTNPTADSDGNYRYILTSEQELPSGLATSSIATINLDIAITDSAGEISSDDLDVEIVRVPTIFAHGLWSNSATYDPILNYIRPKGLFIDEGLYALDYSTTCCESYETNNMVIPNAIDYTLGAYLDAGYITQKATLVGHSMGGALIREYIQNDFGTLPYRDDISRIIFIDTVHSGSQMADFALQITDDFPDSPLAVVGQMGAIIDLSVTSEATQRLNSAENLNKVKLPMHAITSTINTLPNIVNMVANKQYFEAILIYLLDDSFMKDEIFAVDDNDIVVPEKSQKGGLPDGLRDNYITSYSDQWHCSVLMSDQTAEDILDLIQEPTESESKFYLDGLAPEQLSYTDLTFDLVNDIKAKESSERLILGLDAMGNFNELLLNDATPSSSSVTLYYLASEGGTRYYYKE